MSQNFSTVESQFSELYSAVNESQSTLASVSAIVNEQQALTSAQSQLVDVKLSDYDERLLSVEAAVDVLPAWKDSYKQRLDETDKENKTSAKKIFAKVEGVERIMQKEQISVRDKCACSASCSGY